MEDNFEKLNLLLEQELCEFVDIPDGFTGQMENGELRLIYLMNDAVESFLVLKNARMTGNYIRDYEGEYEGSLEKADNVRQSIFWWFIRGRMCLLYSLKISCWKHICTTMESWDISG